MIALATIVIFFLVLVLVYTTSATALAAYSWGQKRRAAREKPGGPAIGITLKQIDTATDRLKNRLFLLSAVLSFFIIAPFLALMMIFAH